MINLKPRDVRMEEFSPFVPKEPLLAKQMSKKFQVTTTDPNANIQGNEGDYVVSIVGRFYAIPRADFETAFEAYKPKAKRKRTKKQDK